MSGNLCFVFADSIEKRERPDEDSVDLRFCLMYLKEYLKKQTQYDKMSSIHAHISSQRRNIHSRPNRKNLTSLTTINDVNVPSSVDSEKKKKHVIKLNP